MRPSEESSSEKPSATVPGLVSILLSPPPIAAAAGWLFWLQGGGESAAGDWMPFATFLLSGVILPAGFVVYLARTGRIHGVFTRDGRQRQRLLLVAAATCLLGVVALGATSGAGPIQVLLLWYGLFGLLAAGLARRWHLSLHAAGAWGAAACVAYSWGWPGLWFAAAAVLVTWARGAAGAHTPGQLAGGAAAGAASAMAVFYVANCLLPLHWGC